MTLPYDTARCNGQAIKVPFGTEIDPQCIKCQRRLSPRQPDYQWYMTPAFEADGVCKSRIGEKT